MKSEVAIGLVDLTFVNPSVLLPDTSSILSQLTWNPLVLPVGRETVPSAFCVMLSARLLGVVQVPLLQTWSVVHWLLPHTHAPPAGLPSAGHRGLALHLSVAQNCPWSQPASPHLHAAARIVVPSVAEHASSVVVPVHAAEAQVCPLKQVAAEHLHLSTVDAAPSAHVSSWLHAVAAHVVSSVHKAEPQVHSLSVNADPSVTAQAVGVAQRLSAAVQFWPMPQVDEPQVHTAVSAAEASVLAHACTSLQVLVDALQSWPALHVAVPHVHFLLTRAVSSTLLHVVTAAHLNPLAAVARQVWSARHLSSKHWHLLGFVPPNDSVQAGYTYSKVTPSLM